MFNINKNNYEIDIRGVNNIRGLAIDMINNAKSGHPGICLGAASIIYTLFKRHMNIYLDNLNYINRDRFVFSAGHGVPLFYSILYMLNLLTLDDLKQLRKFDSKTPGHPEYLTTPLVDMTTGPLGQGVATAVGLAIGEANLSKRTDGVINHYTYVLCGDGDLEEGVSYEALSLAGRLKLNKLIVLYDSNDITLDGNLKLSSNEDIVKRFQSINFNILFATDDCQSIDNCLKDAHNSDLPTIIICKTKIGKYSNLEGSNKVHGTPLLEDDILSIKEKLNLHKTPFTISQEVVDDFMDSVKIRGNESYKDFLEKYKKLKNKELIDMFINNKKTFEITNLQVSYNNQSLRDLSHDILNEISLNFKLLIGGSADLSSSCKTKLDNCLDFDYNSYEGVNINFGVREHAMGAILNGLGLYGFRPFGSTFLAFSDYLRPSIRMSAIMNLPVLYIFTHDSFIVGEDGSAHHPIEQLLSLELIPNLKVYRPFDLNELIGSYIDIFNNLNPSVLILPRDNKMINEYTNINNVKKGLYVIKESNTDNYVTLIANGYELGLLYEVACNLDELGIDNEVISIPCYKNVSNELKETLKNKKIIGITLGVSNYFYEFTNNVIGINTFTKSGTKDELLDHYGFTVSKLQEKILEIIAK